MPDHLYLPRAGIRPTWRDHLRAHPISSALLTIITGSALCLVVDAATAHEILPSLVGIPTWVQASLGAALLLSALAALIGMTWRPKCIHIDGQWWTHADRPLAIERLGWVMIALTATGVAVAVARTGPWALATLLPVTWAWLATARAVSLTWIARDRRDQRERVEQLRIVK